MKSLRANPHLLPVCAAARGLACPPSFALLLCLSLCVTHPFQTFPHSLLRCQGSCAGKNTHLRPEELLFSLQPAADAGRSRSQQSSAPGLVSTVAIVTSQVCACSPCAAPSLVGLARFSLDGSQEPCSPPPPQHPLPQCQSPEASLPCVCIRSILSFCCSYSHPPSLAPCAAPDFV